jgi:hypothetical protein
VVRPVKDGLEDLDVVLRRKLRSNTSWDVEYKLGEKVLIEPKDEPVGHHRNCSSISHEEPCDCGAES